MLSLLYLGVKAHQYIFSSSRMSLDKKTLLKTRLNPGLNLTIFRGTGPRFINPRGLRHRNALTEKAYEDAGHGNLVSRALFSGFGGGAR